MRRWLPVVLLVLIALTSAGLALRLEADRRVDAAPLGGPSPVTPVLSARRVPSVVGAPIADRRLTADLEAWVAQQPSETCLEVRRQGEVKFSHRADVPLVPASAEKLLTAAGALLELGPDATYQTVAASVAVPAGGTIEGDLHLVGGGDPILATPEYAARFRSQPQVFTDLTQLADRVAATGVREIRGAVVGDDGRYDRQRYLPIWPERFITQDQTGPLGALYANDGFVTYPTSPDDPAEVEPTDDPARHAAELLTALLAQRGVAVTAPPRSGPAPQGLTPVAAIESPPMSQVVAQMLGESDNSTAELVLKELGRARAGSGSTDAGRLALPEILREAGLPADGVAVADGSGLATENRTTCQLLTTLLGDPALGPTLSEGLAVAGRSGTLLRRFVGSPVEGALRAKTGSLNQVTALAGDVAALQGDDLDFAYLANLPPSERVDGDLIAAQDQLAMILFTYPRLPDPALLGPLSLDG